MYIKIDIGTVIANASAEDLRDLSIAAASELARRSASHKNIPDATEIAFWEKGEKIKAIKAYRNRTGRLLKESVDDFAAAGYTMSVFRR